MPVLQTLSGSSQQDRSPVNRIGRQKGQVVNVAASARLTKGAAAAGSNRACSWISSARDWNPSLTHTSGLRPRGLLHVPPSRSGVASTQTIVSRRVDRHRPMHHPAVPHGRQPCHGPASLQESRIRPEPVAAATRRQDLLGSRLGESHLGNHSNGPGKKCIMVFARVFPQNVQRDSCP